MDDRDTDLTAPTEDRLLQDMRVDRVIRADGRYLLYYAWSDEPEPGSAAASAPEDDRDV